MIVLFDVGPRLRALGRVGHELGRRRSASLISGTSSSGQLMLPPARMLSPLKSGRASSAGRRSPAASPTHGQTLTSDFGTPQNFVNIVSRVDQAQLRLEAHLVELLLGDLRDRLVGLGVVADDQQLLVALVLARGHARLLEVLGRQGAVALRLRHPVLLGGPAVDAVGLLEAGHARRDEVLGDRPERLAAALLARRVAVEARDHGLADVDVVERRRGSCPSRSCASHRPAPPTARSCCSPAAA